MIKGPAEAFWWAAERTFAVSAVIVALFGAVPDATAFACFAIYCRLHNA